MNDLSGRAAFDRELSEIARMEAAGDAGRNGPRHVRPTRDESDERWRRVWDMAAERLSIPMIASALGISKDAATHQMRRGKPPGASWHDVRWHSVPNGAGQVAVRVEVAAIINDAARRWGCPASAVFATGGARTSRFSTISAARVEASARMRIQLGLTVTACAAALCVDARAIYHAVRRARTDPSFAYLRDEIAGDRKVAP